MVLPCSLHVWANHINHADGTGRQFAWNGLPWDRLAESLSTLSIWFTPAKIASWPVGLLIISAAIYLHRIHKSGKIECACSQPLLFVLTTFLISNILFLLFVVSSLDFWLALDSRTLLPALSASMMLLILLGYRHFTVPGINRILFLSAIAFIIGNNVRRSSFLVAAYSTLGRHHSGIELQQANLSAFIESRTSAFFITNNPPLFFNLTRKTAAGFPVDLNLLTNRSNATLDTDIYTLQRRFRDDNQTFIVVFDTSDNPRRISASKLIAELPHQRVFDAGFFYILQHPRSPTSGN